MEPELWRVLQREMLRRIPNLWSGNYTELRDWMLIVHAHHAAIMDTASALNGRLWPNCQN